jgi:hypothetical protein
MRTAALLMVALLAVACREKKAAEEVPSEPEVRREPSPEERATSDLDGARRAFERSRGTLAAQRIGELIALSDAVDSAGKLGIDVATYRRLSYVGAFEAARRLRAAEAEDVAARTSEVEEPPVPSPPEPSQPIRPSWDDSPEDREFFRELEIGRRQEAAEEQREYQQQLAGRERFLVTHAKEISAAKLARAQREERRRALESSLTRLVAAIDAGLLDEPADVAVPASASASAPPLLATASGAKPSSATAVRKPAADRAACVRACVGSCGDDLNCERKCVAAKCD